MEERRQKSKRLSNMAKFKHEIIWCSEEKGNCKAAAVFGVESNFQLWRKQKVEISGCKGSWRKLSGPKKGQFLETVIAVFTFLQERRKA
jgi:hypothetical protein